MGLTMIMGIVVAAVIGGLGLWAGIQGKRLDAAKAEVRSCELRVTAHQNAEAELKRSLEAQNEAVGSIMAISAERQRMAEAAKTAAVSNAATTERIVKELMARPMSNPGDTCQSACSLLRAPL